MRTATLTRTEQNVDRAASAIFAGACGYAAWTWLAPQLSLAMLGTGAAAVGLAAYLASFRALSAVKPEPPHAPVSVFDVRSFDPMESDELVLDEAFEPVDPRLLEDFAAHHRVPPSDPFEQAELLLIEHFKPARASEEEPLLLDDILAELGPDSRVVRLFDPEAMPTAGELKSRIDRHLGPHATNGEAPDAGQALHDALAELRRSIR